MAEVPSIPKYIQNEDVDFRAPLSENALQKIGGTINYLLNFAEQSAIGEIMFSLVDEPTFQAQMGLGWILCDGRNVSGSRYAQLTLETNIPDARGLFVRSQNLSRTDDMGNPAGNQPIGTQELDGLATHTHNATVSNTSSPVSGQPTVWGKSPQVQASNAGTAITNIAPGPATITGGIDPNGGIETRPRAVTMNIFIKVN